MHPACFEDASELISILISVPSDLFELSVNEERDEVRLELVAA